jgi:prepilin-type N-terminal cleavage/methylation domain-containing protein
MPSRTSFRSGAASDDGVSLIEVLVAMMIFAMLVVGIGYSLTMVLQMTRDNQARETATSLASAELDAVRAIGDPFLVLDDVRSQTVGSNTYKVTRKTSWVTPGGSVDTCGTGGGPLQYKSVSVDITWAGMLSEDNKVRTDTALVPTTRINDPTKGTILVSVLDSQGLGNPGITFTATSSSGAVATTPTNANGCSFVLKVPPGEYTVKLTNGAHKDVAQQAAPFIKQTVDAGSSARFAFQFDDQGTYKLRYASNVTSGPWPELPIGMKTTFFNTNGVYAEAVSTSALSGSTTLYPARTGYEVVAGEYVPPSGTGVPYCNSVDPEAWDPDTTTAAVGTRAETAYADPGQPSALVGIPMGVVDVTGAKGHKNVYAVSQPVAQLPGQPGCDVVMSYSFENDILKGNDEGRIALPFGTWRLYTSKKPSDPKVAVARGGISLVTPGVVDPTGLLTLDPRGVTP